MRRITKVAVLLSFCIGMILASQGYKLFGQTSVLPGPSAQTVQQAAATTQKVQAVANTVNALAPAVTSVAGSVQQAQSTIAAAPNDPVAVVNAVGAVAQTVANAGAQVPNPYSPWFALASVLIPSITGLLALLLQGAMHSKNIANITTATTAPATGTT